MTLHYDVFGNSQGKLLLNKNPLSRPRSVSQIPFCERLNAVELPLLPQMTVLTRRCSELLSSPAFYRAVPLHTAFITANHRKLNNRRTFVKCWRGHTASTSESTQSSRRTSAWASCRTLRRAGTIGHNPAWRRHALVMDLGAVADVAASSCIPTGRPLFTTATLVIVSATTDITAAAAAAVVIAAAAAVNTPRAHRF